MALRNGRDEEIKDEEELNASMDPFYSSTARLSIFGEAGSSDFQVVSDSTYICLFRQSRHDDKNDGATMGKLPRVGDKALVDGNLLMDRFVLAGNTLTPKLEVRFQRSRSFTPLNSKDTLSAWDMDQVPFYESTLCIDFIRHVSAGRFSVIRTPTRINNVSRWGFFVLSDLTGQIDYYSVDCSDDGRLATRGKATYMCPGYEEHVGAEPTFALAPGACTAIGVSGFRCNQPLVPAKSDRLTTEAQAAIFMDGQFSKTYLLPEHPIDLGLTAASTANTKPNLMAAPTAFDEGYTIEAWVLPRNPLEIFPTIKPQQTKRQELAKNVPDFDFEVKPPDPTIQDPDEKDERQMIAAETEETDEDAAGKTRVDRARRKPYS